MLIWKERLRLLLLLLRLLRLRLRRHGLRRATTDGAMAMAMGGLLVLRVGGQARGERRNWGPAQLANARTRTEEQDFKIFEISALCILQVNPYVEYSFLRSVTSCRESLASVGRPSAEPSGSSIDSPQRIWILASKMAVPTSTPIFCH